MTFPAYELFMDSCALSYVNCPHDGIAGIVTVPLGGRTGFGAWNVHGGGEYQALGETTEAFNGGDSSRVSGSIGIGFSY